MCSCQDSSLTARDFSPAYYGSEIAVAIFPFASHSYILHDEKWVRIVEVQTPKTLVDLEFERRKGEDRKK
jgi:hypothetical protein